ncbi:MAG: transcription antitermination factor NusB [Oscillospiraceae bacterium]|jgi:N utilization substance protein B|nr:transcription antitermination factor NusB [Oscillospiraceae bacterium]
MPDARRASREKAFALLFELSFQPGEAVASLAARACEGGEAPPADSLAMRLAETAAGHLEELDGAIAKRLKGWKLNRISRVSHALLRLAVCEMLYFDDIPVGASINEAVELAKLYGDADAPKFINGVLGTIAREEPSC